MRGACIGNRKIDGFDHWDFFAEEARCADALLCERLARDDQPVGQMKRSEMFSVGRTGCRARETAFVFALG